MSVIIGMADTGDELIRKYLKSKYISCIKKAGGVVELMPPSKDADAVKQYVMKYDGIIIPGGADVAPSLYGEQKGANCGKQDAMRDIFEPLLISETLKRKKPLLCICRGMQILNVCFGGTLYQDITNLTDIKHSNILKKNTRAHDIKINKDSILFSIVEKEVMPVNSLHHQAIKTLGNGLKASAESPDGFIEGVELDGYEKCIAIQWHPEHMAYREESQQKIFEKFVNWAKEK